MEQTINITKIKVVLTEGSDKILIQTDMPSTVPNWLPQTRLVLSSEASQDYGVEYVKKYFGVEPVVLNTRVPQR